MTQFDIPQCSCLKRRCISCLRTIGSHWCWQYRKHSQKTADTAYQLDLWFKKQESSETSRKNLLISIKQKLEVRGNKGLTQSSQGETLHNCGEK